MNTFILVPLPWDICIPQSPPGFPQHQNLWIATIAIAHFSCGKASLNDLVPVTFWQWLWLWQIKNIYWFYIFRWAIFCCTCSSISSLWIVDCPTQLNRQSRVICYPCDWPTVLHIDCSRFKAIQPSRPNLNNTRGMGFNQISQFRPNFTISTKFYNFDQISQFQSNFTICRKPGILGIS